MKTQTLQLAAPRVISFWFNPAQIGRRRHSLSGFHVVRENVPCSVEAAEESDCPVAYVAERIPTNSLRRTEIQRFEYRVVDDVLMRGLLGPDCIAPLTLDRLARLADAPSPGSSNLGWKFWRDHPVYAQFDSVLLDDDVHSLHVPG